MKKKLIAIVGATATGKTAISVKIAKKLNSEIISADSRMIYCDLNLGTAKPTIAEMSGIKHNLIDCADCNEEFSVAQFCEKARLTINSINSIPIVVGGTGLYFRILLEGYLPPKVKPDSEYRNYLDTLNTDNLFSLLLKNDEILAEKIHKNNRVKIIRALEVINELKIPMSQAQQKKEPDYEVLWIGLNFKNRKILYEKINNRVDLMVENGLENEARNLYKKYGKNSILADTIGYKELIDFFENKTTLEDAILLIKQNSRHYAKRQISWFKTNKAINWFFPDENSNFENDILQLIEKKGFLV